MKSQCINSFSLFVLALELPGVVQVIPSRLHKLKTTRSWDYLGLSSSHSSTNLLHETNMGDGIIIGLLDTGSLPLPCLCLRVSMCE